MAPGASSPSLRPLASCHPAADSSLTFPLRGATRCPRPGRAQLSLPGKDVATTPGAGSASKIKPHRESRPRRWVCASLASIQRPWDPWLLPTPYGGLLLGAGTGTPLAKRWRSRLCRLSSCGAGFPMGNQRGGAGGKNNTGSSGIVRGNLLSCCLQTQGLPVAPSRHSPFPGGRAPSWGQGHRGDTASRGDGEALGEAVGQAGSTLSVPQFPLASEGANSHASRSCS